MTKKAKILSLDQVELLGFVASHRSRSECPSSGTPQAPAGAQAERLHRDNRTRLLEMPSGLLPLRGCDTLTGHEKMQSFTDNDGKVE